MQTQTSQGSVKDAPPIKSPFRPAVLQTVSASKINFSETNKLFRSASELFGVEIEELATSIKANGLAQPILLRPGKADKWELVAGERRVRACLSIDKNYMIPAYIRDLTEEEALELQIVENLQRKDINPMSEALGFQELINKKKMNTAAIANKIGKSMDYVQERLRLVNLIPEVQDLVRSHEIPLKAGLKFARIPKEQQKDALNYTTTKIPVGNNHKIVFRGLAPLQNWMDNNLYTDLLKADFDKEDQTLNPGMGGCGSCIHRLKNTAGLFDDVTTEDKCLLASCYRTKQINTYKRLYKELSAKFPKMKSRIIFRDRGHNVDGHELFRKELKEIAEVKGAGAGEEITEAKALKDPKANIAILIGSESFHGYEDSSFKKRAKYIFTVPKEMPSYSNSSSESTPASQPSKKLSPQEQEDLLRKEFYKNFVKEQYLYEQYLKKMNTKNTETLMRYTIANWMEDMGDEEAFAVYAVAGIDFTVEKTHFKVKDIRTQLQTFKDDAYMCEDDHLEIIEKVNGKKLQQLYWLVAVSASWKIRNNELKSVKPDQAKVSAEVSRWWKEIVDVRKSKELAEKFVKDGQAKLGIKKGLASLIGKKGGKK